MSQKSLSFRALSRPEKNTSKKIGVESRFNYIFLKCCAIQFLIMRFPRVKAEGQGFYHIISRVVCGLAAFGISGLQGEDAAKFVSMMRSYSAFSGIRILSYSLMSNHFHLVCLVPARRPLSVEEELKRIAARYPEEAQALRAKQVRLTEQPNGLEQFDRLLEPYRRRMNDLSIFVKEFKATLPSGTTVNTIGMAPCGLSALRAFCWKTDKPWRQWLLTLI